MVGQAGWKGQGSAGGLGQHEQEEVRSKQNKAVSFCRAGARSYLPLHLQKQGPEQSTCSVSASLKKRFHLSKSLITEHTSVSLSLLLTPSDHASFWHSFKI